MKVKKKRLLKFSISTYLVICVLVNMAAPINKIKSITYSQLHDILILISLLRYTHTPSIFLLGVNYITTSLAYLITHLSVYQESNTTHAIRSKLHWHFRLLLLLEIIYLALIFISGDALALPGEKFSILTGLVGEYETSSCFVIVLDILLLVGQLAMVADGELVVDVLWPEKPRDSAIFSVQENNYGSINETVPATEGSSSVL